MSPSQLTNAEWLASMPGTDAQKGQLLNCVGCHTLARPLRSKYSADDFMTTILPRMQGYVQQSIPAHPQLRLGERLMEERGDQRVQANRAVADFLASVNLSARPQWNFEFKREPRPTGASTRVIYTEYDLPRETISPHDVIVDESGMVWFSSFGEQNLGRLDPRTGKVTEFPVEEHKPGFPTGSLGLRSDDKGNLWLGNMYQATVVRFDRHTETFAYWPLQGDKNTDAAQINMASPQGSGVDGKVWTQNNGFAGIHRLDIATGKIETFEPFKGVPGLHNIYDIIPDSKNNVYFTDFRQRHIGRIDANSGQIKLYETPTPNSAPRRGTMDAQDRLWFGEYRGDRIGMFDTRTEQFKEWPVAPKWSAPYDVITDKNGEAWTGSMLSDQVTRLNPQTGETDQLPLTALHQYPARIHRQFDHARHLLGRQQPRRLDRQARAAAVGEVDRRRRCAPLAPLYRGERVGVRGSLREFDSWREPQTRSLRDLPRKRPQAGEVRLGAFAAWSRLKRRVTASPPTRPSVTGLGLSIPFCIIHRQALASVRGRCKTAT